MKRKRSHLKLWKLYRLSKNTVGNLAILNSGKTVRGSLRNSSNQMVHLLYGRFWHRLFWLSENYLLGGPAQICVPFFCTWKFWYLTCTIFAPFLSGCLTSKSNALKYVLFHSFELENFDTLPVQFWLFFS